MRPAKDPEFRKVCLVQGTDRQGLIQVEFQEPIEVHVQLVAAHRLASCPIVP